MCAFEVTWEVEQSPIVCPLHIQIRREPRLSLLLMEDDDGARPALLMNDGPFKGQNSLDLLKESADWVEERIFGAIRRAGFDPNEARSLGNFMPLPKLNGGLLNYPTEDEALDP